ncbi:hypothetical protein PAHAL_6G155200 [Panicum hallii]|uniref:Uncharacterized protein n=1 Tax=Panicum hallii TaxID=206008 RepID=A0A2T8IGC3_9POAL|nr:hypothetical protein PAHAL_6G155200 [Panicum hallii]
MLPQKSTTAVNSREERVVTLASDGNRSSWDFPPPDFDIMKAIEEPTPPGEGTSGSHQIQVDATPTAMPKKYSIEPDDASSWTLDSLPDEELQMFEDEAIEMLKQVQAKRNRVVPATPKCAATPADNLNVVSSSKQNMIGQSTSAIYQVLTKELAMQTVGDSSITPDDTPAPRRVLRTLVTLQSPYVEIARKISFKCSKAVPKVYDVVCSCPERCTRSNNRDVIIINYLFNHATLGDLVDSVKPGGKLKSAIVEIAIYMINGKKTRGATRCVMPLHVSTLLLNHQTGRVAVQRAFRKDVNHLDHRQMIAGFT